MKRTKSLSALLACLLTLSLLASCSTSSDSGSTADTSSSTSSSTTTTTTAPESSTAETNSDIPTSIKIGFVNPTTGGLAGLGEGTPWTEQILIDYVNDELGGIYFEDYDTSLPIEIIVYDCQSSSTIAAEMAQKLVEEDGVDILMARHTPDTAIPVNTVADRYGIPCISVEMPTDVWVANEFEYSYQSHWVLEDVYAGFVAMWEAQGYGAGSTVGFLFPSDADGIMFRDYFTPNLEAAGYIVFDPGDYPSGTTDYSALIEQYKANDVDILCGINSTPDAAAYVLQAAQLGFEPPITTMAKATLVVSDAEAMGLELVDGMTTEVWWSMDRGYSCSLTGVTAEELGEMYLADTGRTFTPSMAAKYASMEIIIQALEASPSLESDDLLAAIAEVEADTVLGYINYNESNYCSIPVTIGQWQLQDDGTIELVIIDNSNDTSLAITGEFQFPS